MTKERNKKLSSRRFRDDVEKYFCEDRVMDKWHKVSEEKENAKNLKVQDIMI